MEIEFPTRLDAIPSHYKLHCIHEMDIGVREDVCNVMFEVFDYWAVTDAPCGIRYSAELLENVNIYGKNVYLSDMTWNNQLVLKTLVIGYWNWIINDLTSICYHTV